MPAHYAEYWPAGRSFVLYPMVSFLFKKRNIYPDPQAETEPGNNFIFLGGKM